MQQDLEGRLSIGKARFRVDKLELQELGIQTAFVSGTLGVDEIGSSAFTTTIEIGRAGNSFSEINGVNQWGQTRLIAQGF